MKKVVKKAKRAYVKVCPQCKLPDISIDKSNPLQPARGMPYSYICNRCGTVGWNFPEVEASQIGTFEKEIDRKHLRLIRQKGNELVNTAWGTFTIKRMWKISSISMTLVGLFVMLKQDELSGIMLLSLGTIMFYFAYVKR